MSKLRLTRSRAAHSLSSQELGLARIIGIDTVRATEEADLFVVAARNGDRRAVESLLTVLVPRVRNLVRYLVRGDEETDDIAQEALLAILRGLGGFRAEGPFKAWVDRVVARSTFAFLRKRRREPSQNSARVTSLDLGRADQPAAPDQYLSRRRAVAVLDELSIEQRHAVVLHHVLEMSIPEIGDQLGIAHETVRSRLRLARTKLRARGVMVRAGNVPDDEAKRGWGGEDK